MATAEHPGARPRRWLALLLFLMAVAAAGLGWQRFREADAGAAEPWAAALGALAGAVLGWLAGSRERLWRPQEPTRGYVLVMVAVNAALYALLRAAPLVAGTALLALAGAFLAVAVVALRR